MVPQPLLSVCSCLRYDSEASLSLGRPLFDTRSVWFTQILAVARRTSKEVEEGENVCKAVLNL